MRYTILILLILVACKISAQEIVSAVPLPSEINSENYDEIAPVVSKDGSKLFFVRAFHPENIGGEKAGQDIWYSEKDASGRWTPARNIGKPINDEFHNVVCGTNENGSKLYVARYIKEGKKLIHGIVAFSLQDSSWVESQKISIRGLYDSDMAITETSHFNFHITSDEKYILISMQTEDNEGEEDLYISEKDGEEYTKPISLGKTINSKCFETSPYLSDDGLTLYFASNRDDTGKGCQNHQNAHIYYSTRANNRSWTSWSRPIELAKDKQHPEWATLHSDKFDAYMYFQDPASKEVIQFGYFASSRGNGKDSDIYQLNVERKYQVSVKVVDSQTQQKIASEVILKQGDETLQSVSNQNKEVWKYELMNVDKNYLNALKATTTKENYDFDREEPLKQTDEKGYFFEKIIYLKTQRESKPDLIVAKIYFLFDQYQMWQTVAYKEKRGNDDKDEKVIQKLGVGKDTLDKVILFMQDNPIYEIKLIGYADSIGTVEDNIELSLNRAKTIKDYLIAKGLDSTRILPGETRIGKQRTFGAGEAEHLIDSEGKISNEARRLQRRVEIEAYRRKNQ